MARRLIVSEQASLWRIGDETLGTIKVRNVDGGRGLSRPYLPDRLHPSEASEGFCDVLA